MSYFKTRIWRECYSNFISLLFGITSYIKYYHLRFSLSSMWVFSRVRNTIIEMHNLCFALRFHRRISDYYIIRANPAPALKIKLVETHLVDHMNDTNGTTIATGGDMWAAIRPEHLHRRSNDMTFLGNEPIIYAKVGAIRDPRLLSYIAHSPLVQQIKTNAPAKYTEILHDKTQLNYILHNIWC